jgi:hypothetical protein
MSNIVIPAEREKAWDAYKRKFGKEYPEYYTYMEYGNDWEAEVADINRRIKENDPAPDKPLPKDVVF